MRPARICWPLDRVAPGAPCAGKAYFISQDEPVRQCDLINGILQAGGLPPCGKFISPGAAYVVGALLELAWRVMQRADEPMMTRFLAKQLGTAHWYDISAAKRDLGYVPLVSIAEGLARLKASLLTSTAP